MPAEEIKKTVSTDAQFANAFLQGTLKTLKIQCNYDIQVQKSFKLEANHEIGTEICGVIGLTSSVFMGTISLCFTEKMFLGIMGSMFGETYDQLTDEIADGAGELLNIIFGTAKTILTDSGHTMEKALPTVIRGTNIKVTSLTRGGPTVVVPFEGRDGVFHVLISLSQNRK